MEGPRVELWLAIHHGAQYRQALNILIVEDFHDLRFLVAEAEIGFVEDERASESIECMEIVQTVEAPLEKNPL
ncbi:hypothetical protein [Bradyrhizobium sp. 6(2017)]|uniref:hypothetical protein n=1 Tax=Bradyrhizobium sp. 6(2017) TaxID=1197460 RepID=UPI0013E1D205|nr:hypothetical protein [Bradyrhizobium sp. 6(2017)]QIG95521.1 hypothetical protein G6P99_26050 [Bradyrhizobium sp. 6(2017)]